MSDGATTLAEQLAEIREHCIGKPYDEAFKDAADAGWRLRRVRIDGNAMVGTRDFCTDRINVVVENGIITAVTGLG